MRWIRFAAFILVVTVLQAGMIDIVAFGNVKPDLLLVLLVFFAIYCNTSDAIITSFAIGFAADIIGFAMGPQIISFGLFGTLLAQLHRVITIRKTSYQVVAIFVIGLAAGLMTIFLTFLKGRQTAPNIYGVLLGTSLYSAVIGPFLFMASAWCMRIKLHRLSRH